MEKNRYEIAGISDVGLVKKVNEDSLFYKVAYKGNSVVALCVVADGVGNLQCGELASSIVVEEFSAWWNNIFLMHSEDYEYLKKSLYDCIYIANNKVVEIGINNNIRLASTLALMFLYDNKCLVYNVGDSRVYCIKKGILGVKLQQLSLDHSCNIDKNVNGKIIKKNVLTQYIGKVDKFSVFSKEYRANVEDIYIVCSDGIYKTLKEQEIRDEIIENKHNMKLICKNLINRVLGNKEKDNISIIALKLK
ncbi:MAG: serine/threonine-protein phosphatase [Lachnospiraceae bacterium]|nr:serine/threonine-protein phosphatase [Lachnospiraceae bacterium]